ncbi:hypothetical protein AB0O91_00080 [Kitasatospora sp. NPDC089797]|uniref:hypothetical protein n=1 Tax=Kitasatospora sp. NPDC089797 TaxID=3155298 RepID=UPI0034346095
MRAARQYADALWMAEGEPELAWLLLVSAIEVAATAHQSAVQDCTLIVKEAFPRSAEALLAVGGEDKLAEAAAKEFEGLVRATARFRAFAQDFLPGPPGRRTTDLNAQLSWDQPEKIRKALEAVYGLRSARLHAGTPFPLPLLMPSAGRDGLPAERFTETYGPGDTKWKATELPMTLAAFAYMVRGMLLRWWDTLVEDAASSES